MANRPLLLLTTTALAATIALSLPSNAASGPIERACNASSRSASTPRLCDCIQQVANVRLSNRQDQRLAATFFATPHKAQDIRQSDRSSHEAFWLRYKAFAETAELSCKAAAG
ncbi:MAG: hypothetical protein ABJ327_21110 [Litoreibacter sp.]